MNSVIHPSGPEPENTYWIRRGILAAAALVSLALVWWVLSGLFGGSEEGTVAATPQNPASLASDPAAAPSVAASSAAAAPSPSASVGATPKPSASVSATPKPSATPTPTPTPTAPSTCAAGDLDLSITGAKTPKLGTPTKLDVEITPRGEGCVLDLAKTPVRVEVTSGPDRIWTTAHCPAWAPKGTAKLAAGTSSAHSVTWPLQRSKAECTIRKEALRPGTYRATATIDGGASDTLVMNVRG